MKNFLFKKVGPIYFVFAWTIVGSLLGSILTSKVYFPQITKAVLEVATIQSLESCFFSVTKFSSADYETKKSFCEDHSKKIADVMASSGKQMDEIIMNGTNTAQLNKEEEKASFKVVVINKKEVRFKLNDSNFY